ncbi:MAG TPA: endonuclease I [Leucothrix mucor]|nr:endonuclease I [Leucothrix mucor]
MNTGQTQIKNYSKALRLFWGKVYRDGGKTIYSLQEFGPSKPEWINVEHIFPMAWVVRDLVKQKKCVDRRDCRKKSKRFNRIESDLHNLYPSRRDLNMLRGSYRFGNIKGELRLFGGYDFEINPQARLIEPTPASQGEVARSMFYMADAYDLKIFTKQSNTLAYWNKVDQPSNEEKRRNDLIEELQGTRNHFIDHPKAIETLLNTKKSK